MARNATRYALQTALMSWKNTSWARLCIGAVKAKKLCLQFRLLHWLLQIMAVPMQQTEKNNVFFRVYGVDTKVMDHGLHGATDLARPHGCRTGNRASNSTVDDVCYVLWTADNFNRKQRIKCKKYFSLNTYTTWRKICSMRWHREKEMLDSDPARLKKMWQLEFSSYY